MNENQINGGSLGYENPTYSGEETEKRKSIDSGKSADTSPDVEKVDPENHATWGNSIEFLMSCIAVSVGFGNIWRFPFTAYENGGGAFLIPYVILLFLVGKPFYFLEMIIGQFSSRGLIKIWNMSPAFVGIGCAQLCSVAALITYYSSLMALTLFFLFASFSAELPWSKCIPEWGPYCVDSSAKRTDSNSSNGMTLDSSDTLLKINQLTEDENYRSSAEFYFTKVVLQEKDSIDDGIGLPSWQLTLCLLGSWLAILLVTFKGIKSSGKASYFLAIFPYVVLICLLIRAVTLDGAATGILFFITPQWNRLLDPSVWYAAVTQCFFSLSVCFGSIITYSSHNDFKHNIYRDVMIVTTLDTMTSTIAGCTIFGILGNLAYEMGVEDVGKVVRPGAGLAFVSYPDAIAKFSFVPQLFAVLFFVMMFVLGVGSAVGMASTVIALVYEKYPHVSTWKIVIPICSACFAISTIYVTPGGQFLLTLVDYYGASFVVFILASFEMTAVTWVYGFENFLDDLEFMLDRKPSFYWRICWLIVTPLFLIAIFIYTMATFTPLTYGGREYPTSAHTAGIVLLCFGVFQIPFWMLVQLYRNRHLPFSEMIKTSFAPNATWGPSRPEQKKDWLLFKEEKEKQRRMRTQSPWLQRLCILFCIEPK